MWIGCVRSTPMAGEAGGQQVMHGSGQLDGHGGGCRRPAEGLLDARQLLLAITGHGQGGSPLIGWAHELAALYAALLTASISATQPPASFDVSDIRTHVSTVCTLIDDWSILHLPRPSGARRHTHSLGEVIGHVAETYAQVQWTLQHDDCAEHHHAATQRMAQIQQAYNDLVEDVRALRVEFPLGWRGIRLHRFGADSAEHNCTITRT